MTLPHSAPDPMETAGVSAPTIPHRSSPCAQAANAQDKHSRYSVISLIEWPSTRPPSQQTSEHVCERRPRQIREYPDHKSHKLVQQRALLQWVHHNLSRQLFLVPRIRWAREERQRALRANTIPSQLGTTRPGGAIYLAVFGPTFASLHTTMVAPDRGLTLNQQRHIDDNDRARDQFF